MKNSYSMERYPHGIPADCRWIAVTGEDGVSYDLVTRGSASKHIRRLVSDGFQAQVIRRETVPPCQFRDFTDGQGTYRDATWQGGQQVYFSRAGK